MLVTRTSNVVGAGAVALVAGTKGELKPPARGVQGEEETPCTTLCRPRWKRKRSVALAEAVVMGVEGEAFEACSDVVLQGEGASGQEDKDD